MKRTPQTLPAEVTLLSNVPGGDAFGRLPSGQVVFVQGAFAEDRISVEALEYRKGFARATAWQLLEPASARRASPCGISRRCGGCDFIELDEPGQSELKLGIVRDALVRVGKFPAERAPTTLLRAGPALGYRSRVRLSVSERGELGFLARGSHVLVPVEECRVCSPELNGALRELASAFRAPGEPGDAARAATGQVELRALAPRPEVSLLPRGTGAASRFGTPAFSRWLSDLARNFEVRSPAPRAETAESSQIVALDGPNVHLRVQPGVFTQVNWHVNALLIDDALACARAFDALSFLDVFCGIGNFALPLLRAGLVGTGLDDNPSSIECARAAAREQALDAHFEACPALDGLRRLQRRGERFDLVVVDPPRAGLADALPTLSALAVRGLFYCACDPVSFARDARRLCDLGFGLDSVRAYDLFPQTHHVELTAWFSCPGLTPGRLGA